MPRARTRLCLVETPGQLDAVVGRADVLPIAVNPVVGLHAERIGADVATIEDHYPEAALNELCSAVIERVSDLLTLVDRALAETVDGPALHLVSAFAYFHHVACAMGSAVTRAEQVRAVLERHAGAGALCFRLPPYRVERIDAFGKPVWSLASRLFAATAEAEDRDIAWIDHPGDGPEAPVLAADAQPSIPAPVWDRPAPGDRVLVVAYWTDLKDRIQELWRQFPNSAVVGLDWMIEDAVRNPRHRAREDCERLWRRLSTDPGVVEALTWRGVDLSVLLRPLLERIVVGALPGLIATAGVYRDAFATRRGIVVTGGMVESNHVLARAAREAGLPVVSYHYGGFLGFSLLPMHERYDMAECSHFLCGGPGSLRTFAEPSPLARWDAGVSRAQPVATGLPWVQDILVRSRSESRQRHRNGPRRVMVILSALVGDIRYIGYVYPPEFADVALHRRIIATLAAADDVEVVVKPPLLSRYPQLRHPIVEWLSEQRFDRVRVLEQVPLSECLDEADAFVLATPSTPLLNIVATEKPIMLHLDRRVFRVVPAAAAALRRRASVYAEDDATFFEGLGAFLKTWDGGPPDPLDDTFLHDFLTDGSGDANAKIVAFLHSLWDEIQNNAEATRD